MKKPKLITFFAAILGYAIFSCTNEIMEMDETITEVINAKHIEFVGIEHNMMLDETYEFLKTQSRKKSYMNKSSKSKKEDLEDFLISRIKANRKYSDRSNEIGIENIKHVFKEKQTFSKFSTNSKKTSNSLSDKEKEYLNFLNEILEKIDFAQDNNIEESISNLEKDIESEDGLSDEQLITLFSATQTAKYSYIYWKENWKKWSDLNSDNSTISLKQLALMNKANSEDDGHNGCLCESASGIVKADVAGAVGGAAYAWAANLIPGAGQVAYGGAIVGTAAAGSAIAAVYKIFGW